MTFHCKLKEKKWKERKKRKENPLLVLKCICSAICVLLQKLFFDESDFVIV